MLIFPEKMGDVGGNGVDQFAQFAARLVGHHLPQIMSIVSDIQDPHAFADASGYEGFLLFGEKNSAGFEYHIAEFIEDGWVHNIGGLRRTESNAVNVERISRQHRSSAAC